jgi:ABC-type nitrate/sulfonate/bicarbonate transport system ATPase subunit
MAANTMAGVRSVDGRLRELCVLYKLSRGEQLRRLYIPAIGPFILGGLRSSLSLCWKVVVAAEVLVQPFRALGTGMQTAKAQLETAELFAWTAAAVIAAALSESILTLALWAGKRRRPRFAVHDIPAPAPAMPETPDIALSLTDVSFGFNGTSRNDAPRRGANKARSDYSPDKPAPSDGLLFTGLNLELEGGPVAILGPSGCGKTTLLRLMAGLLRPSSGDIHYKLQSGTLPASAGGPGTAFVFQEPRLLPWLTVLENVILPIEKKLGKAGAVKRARRFLRLLSLEGKENARPDELSGGQRQRVSIARAFAYPAPALFMDEPFQSLDIPLRVRLMDITLKLLAEEPRLIVAVTHDPREAVYLGRRIIVLNAGKVVFDEAADFSREERAYGAPAHGLFEAGLLRVLAGRPFSLAM